MSDSTPTNHIPYVPQNTLDPASGLNLALNIIDALLQTSVTQMDLNSPPSGVDDGERFIVAAPGSGEWAGHDNALARYVAEGDFWDFYPAGTQVTLLINNADGGLYSWFAGSWSLAAGIADAPADGQLYGRKDLGWVIVPASGGDSVSSVNDVTPDTAGNIALPANSIPFTPDSTGGLISNDAAAALNELANRRGILAGINEQIGTAYTIALTDLGKAIRATNAAAITITIPENSIIAIPIGAMFPIYQGGAGIITLAAASGVTFESPFGVSTTSIGDFRMAFKRAANVWVIS